MHTNDYDLAVSNVLAAVLSGVKGLHTTINGLGERAGNAPLASVQAILKDHFNAITNIDESRLNDVSRVVESYSGIVIPANKPGLSVRMFLRKWPEYMPTEIIKVISIAMICFPSGSDVCANTLWGKTSGKANIRKNLESLGLELDEESMKKLRSGSLNWVIRKSWLLRRIYLISSLTC